MNGSLTVKYWDAILNEVVNKDKKSMQFRFTNLGDYPRQKRASISIHQKIIKKQKPKVKNFYMGNAYPGLYFTYREAQCMALMLRGHTMLSSAEILELSPRTIEFYLKNIKYKLKCRTKSELIRKIIYSEFGRKLEKMNIESKRY